MILNDFNSKRILKESDFSKGDLVQYRGEGRSNNMKGKVTSIISSGIVEVLFQGQSSPITVKKDSLFNLAGKFPSHKNQEKIKHKEVELEPELTATSEQRRKIIKTYQLMVRRASDISKTGNGKKYAEMQNNIEKLQCLAAKYNVNLGKCKAA